MYQRWHAHQLSQRVQMLSVARQTQGLFINYANVSNLYKIYINNKKTFNSMLCALWRHYPWWLNLFIQVPFQPPFNIILHTALAVFSALGTYRTHCHICSIWYSFTPESSEAYEGKVPCPKTRHWNNVPILRGEKHDTSLKILHQKRFETARQALRLAKLNALTIAPRPSHGASNH